MVSSLAKAFGVPVAMLGGSAGIVGQFRERSWTRVHCSPPSVAVIAAAAHALQENRRRGEALRALLAGNVVRLRVGLQRLGLAASRSLFPVQPLNLPSGIAAALHQRWAELGVRAVLHGSRQRPHVTCVVTANHAPEEIDSAVATLRDALDCVAGKTRTGVTCEQSSELRSGALQRVLRKSW
jgi:8-amino-7-oxononanoate synthase